MQGNANSQFDWFCHMLYLEGSYVIFLL